jgi:hypothetical protein
MTQLVVDTSTAAQVLGVPEAARLGG